MTSHVRPRRIWLFRLLAVLLGLAPLLLVELLCVAFDWGRPDPSDDPFVGFSSIQPLFELTDDGRQYEIAAGRRDFFAPDDFAAAKGDREFRVFCLGGSTVQGRPYSVPTAFSTWLEIALSEADGSRDWQAVNCGGISYASYRLAPILEEVLNHEPDLIVICTGHNEFLEDRTYGHLRRVPEMLERPLSFLSERRTCVLIRELTTSGSSRAEDTRPTLEAEVDAMLDYRNGLAAYHRDNAWRADVIEHFQSNVQRMIAICRESNVPLILVTPPSNLADQPPFKSEHGGDLTADESGRWQEVVSEAQSLYRTDLERAIDLLEQSMNIDDHVAATWFELGKCREGLHEYESAREAFVRARDEDICPLRMLTTMEQFTSEAARTERVPHLDAHVLLESASPHGILGDDGLVDHVHPSPEGHQEIAAALVEIMAELQLVEPTDDWRQRAADAWDEHLAGLDDFYFLKGQRTIDSVLHWTRGEADGPPAEERFPHLIPD